MSQVALEEGPRNPLQLPSTSPTRPPTAVALLVLVLQG